MISWKNFKIWFIDQWNRDRFFYNFFVSRNAWGAFSINSHINQSTGNPKNMLKTKEDALKVAAKMSAKHGVHFSAYKCLFCDGYHIGKNRDNKKNDTHVVMKNVIANGDIAGRDMHKSVGVVVDTHKKAKSS